MDCVCEETWASAERQESMKKYKLLRFGHSYINRTGDFAVSLMYGDKKHGYVFAAQHANPAVWLGTVQTLSRIVPNDGNWIDISPEQFNVASALMVGGMTMQLTANTTVVSPFSV
jgi:hypothetical protein